MLMMFSIIKTLATGFLHLWYIEAMIIAGAIIYFFGACKYIFHLSIVFFCYRLGVTILSFISIYL